MNSIIKILTVTTFAFVALTSCRKASDPVKGNIEVFDAPNLPNGTPMEQKIKQMYDKYGVWFQPDFDPITYSWNWDGRVAQTAPNVGGMRYTPADKNYVIPVIDSVDKWVFQIFPLEFSKKYLPLNILMTDTMENKYTSGTTVVHRIFEGYIATNYILIPYVSSRFDDEKGKRLLRESWLSLFVEKMLPRWPSIEQFAKHSETGYAKITFTNAEDVQALYAILKKGRTKQNSSTATAAWNRTTPAQDFGDFVAFLVYTPNDEKETIYAKNSLIRTKANLVVDFFKDNFNIDLPYKPITP
ncbi:MAG TPA: putative zinc-binding metallopeptidase [Parasegetibacter sp.]